MEAYFTFETTGGRTSGLMRRQATAVGETLSYMDAKAVWVDDPSLIRHWQEGDLVAVSETQAQEIAVALASP
jgi:hypothetical protein